MLNAEKRRVEHIYVNETQDSPGRSAETAVDGVKDEQVKKEEVKKEEDVKDELKDELEVKTEVKQEPNDDDDDALNDIMQAEPSMSGGVTRKGGWVVLLLRSAVDVDFSDSGHGTRRQSRP